MATTSTLPNGHPGELVLFNFPESIFGRRVVRYLNLRRLPFSQIRVPPNMPRPILQDKLGINHRRIPIMAIGRDIYIDTRLMLRKLEGFFPEGRLGAQDSFSAAFEDMLEEFVIDGGPFWRASGTIPTTAALMQSAVWRKDRYDGSGGQFTAEALQTNRAWNLSQVRLYFAMLEKMLADGRDWILGSSGPGLAEIHAGWVCDWAVNMAADMNDDSEESTADMRRVLNRQEFSKVHAWIERFRKSANDAAKSNSAGGPLEEGEAAEADFVQRILAASFTESECIDVDEADVLGLKAGQRVTVAPVDFGFTHKDEGVLVGLSREEAVIRVNVPEGNGALRLHYPRINFKILRAE